MRAGAGAGAGADNDTDALSRASDGASPPEPAYGSVNTTSARPWKKMHVEMRFQLLVVAVAVVVATAFVIAQSTTHFRAQLGGHDTLPAYTESFLGSLADRKGCDSACPSGRNSVIRVENRGFGRAGIGDRLECFRFIFTVAELMCAQVSLAPPAAFLSHDPDGTIEAEDWSAYLSFGAFRDGSPVLTDEHYGLGSTVAILAQPTGDDFDARFRAAAKAFEADEAFTLLWNFEPFDLKSKLDADGHNVTNCSQFWTPSASSTAVKRKFYEVAGLAPQGFFTFHLRRGDKNADVQEACGVDPTSVASLDQMFSCYEQSGQATLGARDHPLVVFTDELDQDYIADLLKMLASHYKSVVHGESGLKEAARAVGVTPDDNNLIYNIEQLVRDDATGQEVLSSYFPLDPQSKTRSIVCEFPEGTFPLRDCTVDFSNLLSVNGGSPYARSNSNASYPKQKQALGHT